MAVVFAVDTVLQPQLKKKKTVQTPKLKHLREETGGCSKYVLTHQEQDSQGEVETRLYKVKMTSDGQTDRQQTERWTDKQTDRKVDRQTHRHKGGRTDKQTDRKVDRQKSGQTNRQKGGQTN